MPDLLRAYNKDHRLRSHNLLSPPETQDSWAFWEGIRNHLQTDRIYHQSKFFTEIQQQLITLLNEQNPAFRNFRLDYIAHISQELLLDHVLLKYVPDLTERFYEAITADAMPLIMRETGKLFPVNGSLESFLVCFISEKYLNDYGNIDYLIGILYYKVNLISTKKLTGNLFSGFEIIFEQSARLLEKNANPMMADILNKYHANYPMNKFMGSEVEP